MVSSFFYPRQDSDQVRRLKGQPKSRSRRGLCASGALVCLRHIRMRQRRTGPAPAVRDFTLFGFNKVFNGRTTE
jgi:hypothetical protein